MNVQLANVISDLSGATGQRIVRAILAGERDPQVLAKLRDPRVRASVEAIAKSLEGSWQPALLFLLKQEVDMYDTYLQRITECDREVEAHLKRFADRDTTAAQDPTTSPGATTSPEVTRRKRRKTAHSHAPQFDLASELRRISGVDLTRIDGIDVGVAQTLVSEIGLDMSCWPTEGNFASWLGLCPDNRITGDKVRSKGTRRVISRAANALRIAASTLLKSRSYLGAQYRRFRTKLGAPKAITAMAHKLARLVYRMLKYGQEYVDKGVQYYEERHRQQQIAVVKKKAATLGLLLIEPAV